MADRTIYFEGVQNARDLGGLHTSDGHIIKPNHLLRSANLAGVSRSGYRSLREKWKLSKIIDLRTTTERREQPDVEVGSADYMPIPVFDEQVVGISHEKRTEVGQIGAIVPNMERLYRMMVTNESGRKNLGRAASCVMEQEVSAVRDVFLAKASYLNTAFSAIGEQYSDMDAFLCQGLYISHHRWPCSNIPPPTGCIGP